jgi:hypothetical protein
LRLFGLGSGKSLSSLSIWFSAFFERDLRASAVAALSAGLPAPVSDGFSVVFGVSAGVAGLTVAPPVGGGAGDGAPASSGVAFS